MLCVLLTTSINHLSYTTRARGMSSRPWQQIYRVVFIYWLWFYFTNALFRFKGMILSHVYALCICSFSLSQEPCFCPTCALMSIAWTLLVCRPARNFAAKCVITARWRAKFCCATCVPQHARCFGWRYSCGSWCVWQIWVTDVAIRTFYSWFALHNISFQKFCDLCSTVGTFVLFYFRITSKFVMFSLWPVCFGFSVCLRGSQDASASLPTHPHPP